MQGIVFFKEIKEEIIGNLGKANKEIKVAVAWLTDEDIIRTLTQRKEAGVEVEIVISDSKANFKNTSKFKDYLRSGGKLFIATKSFLHHKFCIIDDNTIINGSYNWSYAAKANEENIVVFTFDKSIKEDETFFSKFDIKHKYFCVKLSTFVPDIATLNSFKSTAKDLDVALSQIDEQEIILRQQFENGVRESFEKAVAAKIPISHSLLDRMKAEGGGVYFVKRILRDEMNSGDMKSGFKKLEEVIPHRVELSLEYLVSRPRFQILFRQDEVEFCKKLMAKYNL